MASSKRGTPVSITRSRRNLRDAIVFPDEFLSPTSKRHGGAVASPSAIAVAGWEESKATAKQEVVVAPGKTKAYYPATRAGDIV